MDTQNKQTQDISRYLNLPWTYTIEPAYERGEHFFIIRVNELPEACTDAPTVNEAMELIKEVMAEIFKIYLEEGQSIPKPNSQGKSKIIYITSPEREELLKEEARKRNVELNDFIDSLIDSALLQYN